ncbi:MAG: SDR family NAD(P)-dependent oxidoreductase, partial [Hyphomicrobiales bacterium]|nr:SDR family NAD(P)-dependent oxidoreductase [Hyphomicrobiales bacterium]
MSIKGRNAVVTGSTSGIGLGIALALAREGANVMLNGFGDPAAIEKERAKLAREFSVEVLYDGADMSRPAEIEAMIEQANSKLGSVDILVNNAGIQFVSPVEDFPGDKWEAIIRINLIAVFHATKA